MTTFSSPMFTSYLNSKPIYKKIYEKAVQIYELSDHQILVIEIYVSAEDWVDLIKEFGVPSLHYFSFAYDWKHVDVRVFKED